MKENFILSSERYANSPTVDYFKTIELKSKTKFLLNDENITNINLSDLFNIERENSFKYRLLGTINYLSLINNLNNNYTEIQDFFTKYNGGLNPKNIYNSFKIYILKKSDSYINLGNNLFKERYEVITEIDDITLYNCGFSKNIFNDNIYLYNFNIDVELKNDKDYFNKPITELYLYFDYQLDVSKNEILYTKDYNSLSNENKNITIERSSNITHNLNDYIISNLIIKEDSDFDENIVNEQEYRIKFQLNNNSLQFKYNPFVKIKLRDYNDSVYYGNVSGNTKNIINIPDYAKVVGNPVDGNVIWKELLPHGFIDPITNSGVNFPFVNGSHYVFTNNVVSIQPDLNNVNTNIIFNKQKLSEFKNDLFILNENPDSKC
jgi:hypothetical protein